MSPRAGARLRWTGSLGIVLTVYAAGICAALWWGGRSPPLTATLPADALQVELAPMPEAPPVPASDIAEGPTQTEQHRAEPEPRPEPPLVLPPSPRAQERASQQRPTPRREEQPADAVNVAQTLAPPDVQAPPSDRYAAAQTLAGAQQTAVVTWQGLLLGHLERHRRYPHSAERLRQQGVAYVRFAVDRQGNASNIRVGQSSGHPLLDAETLETVRRGSPVPPPPADVTGNPVEVMVPVVFQIRRGR